MLDLSGVEEGWNDKTGRWRPSTAAIDERCRVARCFVRELVGEAGDVAVVLHGGLVHAFTQDWSGYDERHGEWVGFCWGDVYRSTMLTYL